jgi:protein gp37
MSSLHAPALTGAAAVTDMPAHTGEALCITCCSRKVPAMADRSTIEWTEATWNPTTGCDQVSPGCDNCYALTLAKRLKAMGSAKYQLDGDPCTSGPGFRLTVHPDTLDTPRRWREPRLIFVNSMSDLFHDDVPTTFIRDVFAVIADTPQHTYQVLTKRAHRLSRVASELDWPDNLWMGVSVESRNYTFRINHLRTVPAALRFISAEPLLGPLGELDLTGVGWVIAGGESGPHARPVEHDWVTELRDSCTSSNVPFFFKQWGGRTPKTHGRELDGEIWDQTPARPAR